jgi:hypothetical protein
MFHTPGATCHETPSSATKTNESKSYMDVVTAGSDPAHPNNPEGVHMTSAKKSGTSGRVLWRRLTYGEEDKEWTW